MYIIDRVEELNFTTYLYVDICLNLDKNRNFFSHLPSLLVHDVVIEHRAKMDYFQVKLDKNLLHQPLFCLFAGSK